ncbi:DUF2177 family protein [Candidatus Peregrinibacteria bacterium]|nr:MAG: DUF2177 family protein [Candidatus Peregrinibacteria bacterium]
MSTALPLLAGFLSFIALDFVWLRLLMYKMYKNEIGSLMKPEVNYAAAALVYLAAILGIYFFVLPKVSSLSQAALWGALFGGLVYAIYDFTNLAILKNWTLKISLYDAAWGAMVCAAVSTVMFWVSVKG